MHFDNNIIKFHTVQLLYEIFAIAIAAIGLNTSSQAFVKAGPRDLFLGAATWSAVMLS
jgi:uncharacterized membrane protein YadS